MLRKSIALLSLCLLSLCAFAQNVKIEGKILNNKFSDVQLVPADVKDASAVAHATISEDGNFMLKTTLDSTNRYLLKFADDQWFLLCLSPKDQITLTLDAHNLNRVIEVKGSPSILFTKQMSDLLLRRKDCLDSVNRELQNDPNQLYLIDFVTHFTKFQQSFANVQPDLISALQKCDSIQSIMARDTKSGKVVKKSITPFLNDAIANLKLMKNYYASYKNYLQLAASTHYDVKMENPQFKEFEANVATYTATLEEYNNRISSTLGVFAEHAEGWVSQYDEALYASQMETPKQQLKYANYLVSQIEKYAPTALSVAEVEKQSEMLVRLGGDIVNYVHATLRSIVQDYQNDFNKRNQKIEEELKTQMLLHKSDLAVLFFLDNFSQDKNLMTEVVAALYAQYPTYPVVRDQYNKINTPEFRTAQGSIAPELEFPNPDGKMMKLSDLRGKVVLIDFWASWCGPCRRENPHVVKLYNKYHSKGFEVFSVSLDNNAGRWKEAIQKDQLIWPYHVSDLKGWSSAAAKLYGVNSIPCTFLIDAEGRILARGLRGDELTQKLKQIFGE